MRLFYYSATTGGLYFPPVNTALFEVDGDTITPIGLIADAKPITEERHAELVAGLDMGKILVPDQNGYPQLADPAPPTTAELLADATASVLADLDTERDRLRYAPIGYGGTLFDADADSQSLISGTLSRLTRGDGLPTPWVGWRDHLNIQHWALDDAEAVSAHLRSLAGCIENREAAIRVASWQKKAEVAALNTVDEIQVYSIQTGWPPA